MGESSVQSPTKRENLSGKLFILESEGIIQTNYPSWL